ncbi:MAG: SGNH/GDSL hydrolase family protein [Rhizonema sp. PD38]|nr:SGNH/GDSL hydrolase family protein [Rhizonema sp. PD38]
MTKFKPALEKFLISVLIFTGLVSGLVIAEIGLRIAGFEYSRFDIVDYYRGWADRPNFSSWFNLEGGSYVQINSEGFRDREHTKIKPENTLRIALLGDSMVSAYEVPAEQDMANLIEQKLNTDPILAGTKVEVIKFGVRGYGTDQELITLRQKVWDYSPDIVLLAFYHYNDVIDNSRALSSEIYRDVAYHFLKPYFLYEKGHLVLDNSFVNTSDYQAHLSWWSKGLDQIRDHSRLLQFLSEVKFHLNAGKQVGLWRSIDESLEPTVYDEVYREPTDSQWQQAWQVTDELIKLMHSEIKTKGADFIVATVSDGMQIYPDSSVRQKFIRRLGVTDLFYPEKRIQALGDRYGFKVINLAPIFQDYADKNKVCLQGFDNLIHCRGHLNLQGHRLASNVISQELSQEIQQIKTRNRSGGGEGV